MLRIVFFLVHCVNWLCFDFQNTSRRTSHSFCADPVKLKKCAEQFYVLNKCKKGKVSGCHVF